MNFTYISKGLPIAFKSAAFFSSLVIIGIIVFLVVFSAPLFTADGLSGLFSASWLPHNDSYGILPMLAGSLSLSILALLIAFPAAIGLCCFAHGIGPAPMGRMLLGLIHFMTAIPTVVYAFVSAVLLVPFIRDLFGYGSGYALLTAGLVLSLLILPTIVLLIEAWWRPTISELRLTCSSLGMTPAQALFKVVLPVSRKGLAAAAIFGFGRAIGDTMIGLMLAGNAPRFPGSPLDSIRTLAAHIAFGLEADTQSPAYHSVFACGLILIIIMAAVHIAIRRLARLKPEVRS